MNPIFLSIAAVLVVILFAISFRGMKSRKVKITTAEADENGTFKQIIVTRKFGDGWYDLKDMKVYHTDDNKRIWLANHWVLRVEEV